jgi:hypothetical protein
LALLDRASRRVELAKSVWTGLEQAFEVLRALVRRLAAGLDRARDRRVGWQAVEHGLARPIRAEEHHVSAPAPRPPLPER